MNNFEMEAKIRLDYDIPNYLTFSKNEDNHSCPLCSNLDVFYFSAPFIEGGVPHNKIVGLINNRFNLSISESNIFNHIPHINSTFDYDANLRNRQVMETVLIKSSMNNRVNIDEVIEDNITSLQSRMLEMRSSGEVTGKEFLETSKTLMNWVALKKKLSGELSDNTTIDLSDVIDIKRKGVNGESRIGDASKDAGDRSVILGQHVIKTETRTSAIVKATGDR